MKRLIPAAWRLRLRLAQRAWQDRRAGLHRRWAARHAGAGDMASFEDRLSIRQSLGSATGDALERKKHNLRTAARQLERVLVLPGQVFSFWRCVGEPGVESGYREGRTIVAGALSSTTGGGLCQLSGLVYLLSLQAGLKIIERHSHSGDIYTEATRFAPLGSDATVVYGYKDLRVLNDSPAALCFRFEVDGSRVTAFLCSPQDVESRRIEFKAEALESATRVETWRHADGRGQSERISCDIYPKLR